MLKLLIADDEELERRALRYFAQELPGVVVVGEARTGHELVNLATAEGPDLAFIDIKMPGLSGLQALSRVRAACPNMLTIIISAYEDFAFAQEAIKLGAFDYITKPASRDQILSVARRAAAALEQEQQRREQERRLRQQLEATMPFIQTALALDLVDGTRRSEPTHLAERAAFLGLPGLPDLAMVVNIDNFRNVTAGQDEVHRQALKQQVLHTVQAVAAAQEGCLVTPMGCDDLAVLARAGEDRQAAIRLADSIRQQVQQQLPVTVTIGVGQSGAHAGDLSASYAGAQRAVRLGRFFYGANRVIAVEQVDRRAGNGGAYSFALERELAERARWGDRRGARQAGQTLLERLLAAEGTSLDYVLARLLELVVVLTRTVAEGGAEPNEALALGMPLVQSLRECATPDDLRAWLDGAVERSVELVVRQHRTTTARLIQQVLDYVADHYAGEITLEQMSDLVYLNTSYFCRAFKQHTGHTFVEYLTRVRVQHACDWLATSDEQVAAIARRVGYEDPNYFSRVFNRTTGVPPTEFRNRVRGSARSNS